MRINGRGAGLEPRSRGAPCSGDRLPDDARRLDARPKDLLPIRRVVAAVDAAPREVDYHLGAVNLALPVTQRGAVLVDDAPLAKMSVTGQHHDIVAVRVKSTRQDRSNLP